MSPKKKPMETSAVKECTVYITISRNKNSKFSRDQPKRLLSKYIYLTRRHDIRIIIIETSGLLLILPIIWDKIRFFLLYFRFVASCIQIMNRTLIPCKKLIISQILTWAIANCTHIRCPLYSRAGNETEEKRSQGIKERKQEMNNKCAYLF